MKSSLSSVHLPVYYNNVKFNDLMIELQPNKSG